MKKSNWFCFGCTVFVTSVVSGKQLLWDRGGFGEFSLVLGSKIHLNELWYRLRVPGDISTQKFLKYLPPPPGCVQSSQRSGFNSRSSQNFFRFFSTRLGCSFYREDHFHFPIFIRSSKYDSFHIIST